MLHKVGKQTFVLGVDWYAPRDRKGVAELRKRFKGKRPMQLYVPDQDLRMLGFADAKEKGIVASCVVAKAFENGCFIVELNETHVWLCYVFDGHPAAGFDKIVEKEHVKTELENLSDAIGEKIEPKLYAFDEGDEKRKPEHFWQTLVNRIQDGEIEKLNECIIGRINPLTVVLMMAALGLAGAAVWPQIEPLIFKPEPVIQKPIQPVVAQPVKQGPTPEELRTQRHAQLKDAFEKRLKQAVQSMSSGQMLDLGKVQSLVESLPWQAYGYQPTQMRCNLTGCELTWRPMQVGRMGSMKVRLQDRVLLPHVDIEKTLSQGGESQAFSRWDIKPLSTKSDRVAHPELVRIKTLDAWSVFAPKSPYSLTYQHFQAVTVKGEPEIAIKDRVIGWKAQGAWRANGQNNTLDTLWLFADFANSHGMRIEKIDINWNNGKIQDLSADFRVSFLNSETVQ